MNQEDLFQTIYQTRSDIYVQCRNIEIDMFTRSRYVIIHAKARILSNQ